MRPYVWTLLRLEDEEEQRAEDRWADQAKQLLCEGQSWTADPVGTVAQLSKEDRRQKEGQRINRATFVPCSLKKKSCRGCRAAQWTRRTGDRFERALRESGNGTVYGGGQDSECRKK